MTTHVLKIRPHFINSVKNGKKTHEYRLATPDRLQIKIGDCLVLVSNQDSNDYVRVHVESIATFPNWEAAFEGRWEKDFEGLYSSFADLLKEVHRFYTPEQVQRYGVVVFTISADNITYEKRRFLLDTNVIIHRESQDASQPLVGKLYQWLDKIHGQKLYHPLSLMEIGKHQDKEVVESFKNKLNGYIELNPTCETDSMFMEVVSSDNRKENSYNDNQLLLQVHQGRVDYLVTDDKGLLKKANQLYLRERVLSPEEFIQRMERLYPSLVDYPVLLIQKERIGNLSLDDPFFISLQEDYGATSFNKWLNGKSEQEAYVFRDEKGALRAFLYLKQEGPNEPFDFDKPMKKQNWLKVGTFKNTVKGLRVGERFLKIIFDNAVAMNVDGIYITLFEDKRKEVKVLRSLVEQWGFVPYCHSNKTGELVLVKNMRTYNKTKDPMFNFPLTSNEAGYMWLPIESFWHEKLFPDSKLQNENTVAREQEACSYATEKIYITASPFIKAIPGDFLLIYRIGEHLPKMYSSVLTGVAILQKVHYPKTEEELLDLAKNKSVFSEEELKSFWKNGQAKSVIRLLYLKPFSKKITLKRLQDLGIIPEYSGARINAFVDKTIAETLIKEGEEQ